MLDLFQRDKCILESDGWLNDGIVYAVQTLLSQGKVFGWQSTQLSKREELFKPIPSGPFIQILHISNCHWVVASNVNSKEVQGRFSHFLCHKISNMEVFI